MAIVGAFFWFAGPHPSRPVAAPAGQPSPDGCKGRGIPGCTSEARKLGSPLAGGGRWPITADARPSGMANTRQEKAKWPIARISPFRPSDGGAIAERQVGSWMVVYERGAYRSRMREKLTQVEWWDRRRAMRERLRNDAVAAMRRVKPGEAMTWIAVAERLNEAGVTNELGREWSGETVAALCRKHEEATGEGLLVWLRVGDKRESGRRSGLARIRERDQLASKVAQACREARSFEEAARLLNETRLWTRRQQGWTAGRVREFERKYRRATGKVVVGKLARKRSRG